MLENVIETKDLSKQYGRFTALDNVNIQVSRGEIYGLIGDNGAGKTTLLKLLTGQIYPSAGEMKMLGAYLPGELEVVRRRTGVLIESAGFYPQLNVEQNLEYYRLQKGVPGKAQVEKTLHMVGLLDKRKKRCRDLSMGMKQRLGLAIALIGEPEILILDEPINGLDPSGIIEMRQLLMKLNREKNITIILSSHILSELEQLATVFGFLSQGKLLEQISCEQLMDKCADYIEIAVSDAARYTVLLERTLGHSQYKVMPDETIHILNPARDIDSYSGLAGENHLHIYRLSRKKMALEDYYVNLKNGGVRL